jgi:ubiquinone/menaquinone biosynthesis C-methylase UbiE
LRARGLDIGCGIGLSSLALARHCRRVLGVDPSVAMIGRAPRADRVDYLVAAAERLPARDSTFDVITLGQVVHWIDWAAFLGEAHRVARPGGWVVAYDHFLDLAGEDAGASFVRGLLDAFYDRYPRPPRYELPLESAERWGAGPFRVCHQEEFRASLQWSQPQLIDYLAAQSNVNTALAEGRATIEEVRAWLGEHTGAGFATATEVAFAFSGPIVWARREA